MPLPLSETCKANPFCMAMSNNSYYFLMSLFSRWEVKLRLLKAQILVSSKVNLQPAKRQNEFSLNSIKLRDLI
jgi:hypothetical protein